MHVRLAFVFVSDAQHRGADFRQRRGFSGCIHGAGRSAGAVPALDDEKPCAGLAAVYFLKPAWLEGLFPKLLNSLALFGRFDNFVNGLFDISSLVYFVSVALLFVFFTCQGFEKRRWS